jgi:hypothetical protein
VLGVVLAVGLLVVARGLSRGQPLLAPLVPASDEDGDADDGDAQDEEP